MMGFGVNLGFRGDFCLSTVGVVALSVIGMPNLAVRMISCPSVYIRDYLEENQMKELNICKL